MPAKRATDKEQELMTDVLQYKYNPYEFVMYAFPWGVAKTPLERFDGPRQWQKDDLMMITDHIQTDLEKQRIGLPPEPMYIARSSGRGPGKSALMGMLSHWFMSTWLGGTEIITANTETQLRSRTMAEIGKWNTMAINSHWFNKSATSVRPADWFAKLLQTQLNMDTQYYYADAQTWSEENPDAFAGAHSMIAMMLVMDEASGIPDCIWDVSEGFFTDLSDLRLWMCYSNPRRNTGAFFECFHKNRALWNTRSIDSRTVEGIDTAIYHRIAEKHGEDHDVTRVEVKGEFPRQGSNQFISRETVTDACLREAPEPDRGAPLIMGIDVARFGDDQSVFFYRKGRDARSIPYKLFKGVDTMQLASYAAEAINEYRPDAVFVDGGGVGGGVVDRLKQMGFPVVEVQAGSSPDDKEKYANKRVEMWDRVREWLLTGTLPDEQELVDDLTGPEYKHDLNSRIQLERKDEMKKRGLASPDIGDALGLTFAETVGRSDSPMSTNRRRTIQVTGTDYDMFG